MKPKLLLALAALVGLTPFAPPTRAAVINYLGDHLDLGSGWRTPSVAKPFDLNGDNVIGTDGYDVVNRPAILPSYIASATILTVTNQGNGNYASMDDPANLPALFQSGAMTANPGAGVSANLFRFTLSSAAVGRTIRVALLVDNLDLAASNSLALEVDQTNGSGATSGSVATTLPLLNDRTPDWLFFDITGGAASDVFLIRGLGGSAGAATLGGVAFDSVASTAPGANFVLQTNIQATTITNTPFPISSVAVSGDTMVVSAMSTNLVAVFVRSGTNWVRQTFLTGNNSEAGDSFGSAVAIYGDTVIVGAFQEASADNVINGAGGDNSASSAGAAYIFVRNGTNWTQQAYLKASDNASGFYFGGSVALFGDTAVVGTIAPKSSPNALTGESVIAANNGAGAAYVFVRQGTNWTQQARLTPSNAATSDIFGFSLALFDDTLVVGAPFPTSAGAAYVFVRQGTNWTQQARLQGASANSGALNEFGMSVGISGDTVAVGAPQENSLGFAYNNLGTNNGAVYVFARTGTNWSQQAFLKATDAFEGWTGETLGISDDTVVAGGQFTRYVFQRTGTQWFRQPDLAQGTLTSGGLGTPPPGVVMSGGTTLIHDVNGTSLYHSPAPNLAVEDTFGVQLAFGGDSRQMAVQDGQPDSQTFTLSNLGDGTLTGVALTLDGPDAALFAITTNPSPTVAADGSTTFTLGFGPGAGSYPKSATLHIASSDSAQGAFNLSLTGYNLLSTMDSDGDGLNDVAEFRLRGLGFNWQVSQVPLVNAYLSAAASAGLYSTNQVQALNVGPPRLSQTAPGQFKLTVGVQKAIALTNFLAFPMSAQQTTINGNGELQFLFTPPDNAAFYRVQAH